MIKEAKVFKTDDGKIFEDKGSAVRHDLMIQIRGIIQSHCRGDSFTPTEIATMFAKEQDTVFTTLGNYRKRIGAIKGAAARANSI